MKRYLLFCFDAYYPQGGSSDARGSFDTIAEAKAEAGKLGYDGYEILDLEKREWVK